MLSVWCHSFTDDNDDNDRGGGGGDDKLIYISLMVVFIVNIALFDLIFNYFSSGFDDNYNGYPILIKYRIFFFKVKVLLMGDR